MSDKTIFSGSIDKPDDHLPSGPVDLKNVQGIASESDVQNDGSFNSLMAMAPLRVQASMRGLNGEKDRQDDVRQRVAKVVNVEQTTPDSEKLIAYGRHLWKTVRGLEEFYDLDPAEGSDKLSYKPTEAEIAAIKLP